MRRWLAVPALCTAACLAAPPDSVGGTPEDPDGGGGGDSGPVEPVDPGPVTIRSIGPTEAPIAEADATVSENGRILLVPASVADRLMPGVMVEIGGDLVAVRAIGWRTLLLEEPVAAGGPAAFWHGYTSLSEWKTDRERDLVSEGVSEVVAVAVDLTLPSLFSIDGFETDAEHRVIVRAADGRGHQGVADTGVTITADPSACLRVEIDHVTVEGLEFRDCGTDNAHAAVKSLDSVDVLVDRILVHDYRGAQPVSAVSAADGGEILLRNSIVHGGMVGVTTDGDSTVVVESCTFFDLDGSAVDIAQGSVRNTIMIQTDGTFSAGEQDHNVADFALSGAINSTAGDLFVAPIASPPDLHLAARASAALGAGADLRPAFEHDIDGDPRGGVWDIGADQQTPAP